MNIVPVRVAHNRYILVDTGIANARSYVVKFGGNPELVHGYSQAQARCGHLQAIGYKQLLAADMLSDDMDYDEYVVRLAKYKAALAAK